ncbi:metallophosphoesterase [Piscinibacter sp.]|uniref:metallophosphoesterase n=1 Tax=Piscinibacter sp. TaxID=1903157 RepID=UPI0039E42CC3
MSWRMPLPALAALALALGAAAPAAHALDCAQLATPIYQAVNPNSQANLLTRWSNEVDSARAKYGFADVRGEVFKAATAPGDGLLAVHRLYRPGSNDFVWITNPAEIASAVARYGYVDQGANFYAAAAPAACAQPVFRLLKGAMHRHATTEAERDALVAAGWRYEMVSFYAARRTSTPPPVASTKFSIAMIPDTQNEVQLLYPGSSGRRLNDWRIQMRNQWLVTQREPLKLAFVGHTGDLVNWGETEVPEAPQYTEHQYKVASAGMDVLGAAGIPYGIALGNHDTRAVCAGGSACPGQSAHANVRLSPLFNRYFDGKFTALAGRMTEGELQNHYSVFEAGGLKWLALVVEFMPRQEAVNWAREVIAAYPRHNVIVMTHAFLDGGGNVIGGNDGYGDKSPAYLWDTALKMYSNVKFVFSGHTGVQARRTLTGTNQNRVEAFNQTFHDNTTAPVRIVEIDTAAGGGRSYVVRPARYQSSGTVMVEQPAREYEAAFDGMSFVR